jgi:hypothetical protein
MYTCDHCRSLLWEDQFGLLEAGVKEGLRQHLVTCDLCQAERVRAEADYRLLAQAAKLDVEVPLFTAPVSEELHPEPIPEILPLRKRRPSRWVWPGAAAAALLLAGVSAGLFYQDGLIRRESAYQEAEKGIEEIVAMRGETIQRAANDARDVENAHAKKIQQLKITGFADAPLYSVSATNLHESPTHVNLTARLLNAAGQVVAEAKDFEGAGNFLLPLRSVNNQRLGSATRLEVRAQGPYETVQLEGYIPARESPFITCLTADKSVYSSGDRIYFRSVTLERLNLLPPSKFVARYALKGPKDFSMPPITGETLEGGVGCGAFQLPGDCPEGEYLLTMNGPDSRFQTASRRVIVHRPTRSPAPAAGSTHAVQVDFFPEGGDLVADAPQRVYFRAWSSDGKPVHLSGKIVDDAGHEIVAVQTYQKEGQSGLTHGLGVFTFTPRHNQTYRLQYQSPEGVTRALSLPDAHAVVSLKVRNAVVNQQQPFEVTVPRWGSLSPYNTMLIGVFCQGRLVAQQGFTADQKPEQIRLYPTENASGIMRMTLFTFDSGELQPLAERLVYRHPAKRLNLSVVADKASYAPGDKVKLAIRSQNEKKQAEPSRLLASVVRQDVVRQPGARAAISLPRHFYLASELEAAQELEEADLIVGDSPQAAAELDLFLGTQGWRRFIRSDERLASNGVPGVMTLSNAAQAEEKLLARVNPRIKEINAALAAQVQKLEQQGHDQLTQARSRARELDAYKAGAVANLRFALGVGGFLTLAAGCVLLVSGLLRLVRDHAPARPRLAVASGALSVCLVLMLVQASDVGRTAPRGEPVQIALLAKSLNDTPDTHLPLLAARPATEQSGLVARMRGGASELHPSPEAQATPRVAQGSGADFQKRSDARIMKIDAVKSEPGRPRPLFVREYAYDFSKIPARSVAPTPSTILWTPALFAGDGTAQVEFDLPKIPATYRIQIEGHTDSGRLGAVQRTLEVRQK